MFETIDFCSKNQQNMYQQYERVNSVMSLVRNSYTLLCHRKIIKKITRFNEFIDKYIPTTDFKGDDHNELMRLADKYDLFLCGSDQIWNTNCYDFDLAYMLEFVSNKQLCCSYAASIGVSSLDAASEDLLKKYLSDFKALSVREPSGAKYLESVINRTVEAVLDPVFLIDGDEWRNISLDAHIHGKFVLGYYIGDMAGMRRFGEKLAKKVNGRVVVILKNLRDIYGKNIKAYETGPKEFLWLIDHAEYICTNSFHAVAFSVILKKKFWVFVDRNFDGKYRPQGRIVDITDMLGLSNRVIDENSCENIIYDEQIDWSSVYTRLQPLIKKSKDYLEKVIGE